MLVARVRRTIVERELIARGDHVLVGCSGGPDSTALVHVLEHLSGDLGFTIAVASVDHGLRSEAKREVGAVRTLAETLGVPFFAIELALEPGAAVQARGRAARYRALLEAAASAGAASVAVGHTRDDQAETVLHRLTRGASIRGLSAIDPARSDGVVRPLIDARRADVDDYLRHFGLSAIDDPSNRDRRFTRARVRAELLPLLERENPRIVEQLAELADEARDVSRLVAVGGERLLATARTGPRALSITRLADASRPERLAAVAAWITAECGLGPSRAQLVAIDRLIEHPGAVRVSAEETVERDGEALVLR